MGGDILHANANLQGAQSPGFTLHRASYRLEEILGSPLPDICFLLACLPVRKGGLGIRNPALVLGPAFIASNFSLRAHKANSQRGFGASWLKPGRASSEYRNTGRD